MNHIAPLSASLATDIVTLSSSPLRHVLCVTRFSPILNINRASGEGVAEFQEQIRATYPNFRQDQQHELRIEANESGLIVDQPTITSHPAWVFFDHDERWTITLTQQSIALATTGDGYAGRNDIIARLVGLLEAMKVAYKTVVYERLGFRFVNLFQGKLLKSLDRYANRAMIGFGRQAFEEGFVSSFGQTEGKIGQSSMIVKTGRMRPGTVSEMFTTPLLEPAWLLDIDAGRNFEGDMSIEAVHDVAVELTNLNCQMFRWSVTDKFMEEFRHG